MWFFNSPRIVFGEDALEDLEHLEGQRAFLVTDANMVKFGFVHRIQGYLGEAGIESQVFSEVEPEPSLQTVRRCAETMTAYQPDWIIGLGGGSSMDAAKAAWLLYENPDADESAINPLETYGLRSTRNAGIGDFADIARLAELAAGRGANVLGLSPLHARFRDQPERACPYAPSSRRWLDPYAIAIDQAAAELQIPLPKMPVLPDGELIDYPAVAAA
ncbi:MAG: 4-alpha-glucanotransferase, partial [Anaerolineae bacterium]